jgi:protein-tyrosine phosphatase
MASQVIIFVCTGNTCRSPMAEALCRRRLSEKLHCADDELLDHGFAVLSAGLSAVQGSPANPEAVSLLETFGVGLHDHESQPLTRELIAHADRILTMTRSHRDQIVAEVPGASGKVRLLSPEGRDLSDPLGGGPNEYQECCSRITSDLDVLVEELLGGEEKVN